jgi:endonuclease YncB( thermonuclease family)
LDFVKNLFNFTKVKGKDRYGRLLAEIITEDGKNLNQELVKAGLAWGIKDMHQTTQRLKTLKNYRFGASPY